MCECGYTREQHLEEAVRPHAFQSNEWDPKKHVQEMPTDAFGDIVFTGLSQKVGKVGFHHPVALTVDQSLPVVTPSGQTSGVGVGGWLKVWGHRTLPTQGWGGWGSTWLPGDTGCSQRPPLPQSRSSCSQGSGGSKFWPGGPGHSVRPGRAQGSTSALDTSPEDWW